MNTTVKPAAGSLMPKSIISDMAERFGMEKEAFQSTLMKTVMPGGTATNEQVAAFLVVAKHYDLNPFTREIFAFPAKGGGIQPIVSIDGWLKILNSSPYYDGMEFKDHVVDGELTAITCRIFHKQRTKPIEVTEYMAECKRGTDPWRQWPVRMLRHKAVIQCARYAFGFSGIIEPDEYERIGDLSAKQEALPPVGSGVSGLRLALTEKTPPDPEASGEDAERHPENQAAPEPTQAAPAPSAEPQQQEKAAKHRRPPVNIGE